MYRYLALSKPRRCPYSHSLRINQLELTIFAPGHRAVVSHDHCFSSAAREIARGGAGVEGLYVVLGGRYEECSVGDKVFSLGSWGDVVV